MRMYLALKHMQVHRATIWTAFGVYSVANPVAAILLGHKIARDISGVENHNDFKLKCLGAQIVFHNYQINGEFVGYADKEIHASAQTGGGMEFNPAKWEKEFALPGQRLQPQLLAEMCLSIIYEFEFEEDDMQEQILQYFDENEIRYAGGTVSFMRQQKFFSSTQKALNYLGAGFLLVDRRDTLLNQSNPYKSAFDEIAPNMSLNDTQKATHGRRLSDDVWGASHTYLPETENRRGDIGRQKTRVLLGSGGYSIPLWQEPRTRRNSRGGYKHSYGFPIVIPIEFVLLSYNPDTKQREMTNGKSLPDFWREEWIKKDVNIENQLLTQADWVVIQR